MGTDAAECDAWKTEFTSDLRTFNPSRLLGKTERWADLPMSGRPSSELADNITAFDEGLVSIVKEPVGDRKSTRLNSSHAIPSRMPSSA